jgi:hypothetical protein
VTTLDDDEQDELALKLRFGVGLELLVGARAAAAIRAGLPARPPARQIEQPELGPARPDHEICARAAALGVTAGRRGQWIRR